VSRQPSSSAAVIQGLAEQCRTEIGIGAVTDSSSNGCGWHAVDSRPLVFRNVLEVQDHARLGRPPQSIAHRQCDVNDSWVTEDPCGMASGVGVPAVPKGTPNNSGQFNLHGPACFCCPSVRFKIQQCRPYSSLRHEVNVTPRLRGSANVQNPRTEWEFSCQRSKNVEAARSHAACQRRRSMKVGQAFENHGCEGALHWCSWQGGTTSGNARR
jgi:hypothetical protein